MNRTVARENAFKLLYEEEIKKDYTEENVELFVNNFCITDENAIEYIKDISQGITEYSIMINDIIEKNLKEEWTMNRISKINIAILKLAIYEMLIKKLPYKGVINEAVELAKKYGDDTSHSFINGILASVVKEQNLFVFEEGKIRENENRTYNSNTAE